MKLKAIMAILRGHGVVYGVHLSRTDKGVQIKARREGKGVFFVNNELQGTKDEQPILTVVK